MRWLPDEAAEDLIRLIHLRPEFESPLVRAFSYRDDEDKGRQHFVNKQLPHMPTLSALLVAVQADADARSKHTMKAWRPIEYVGAKSQDDVRNSVFVKGFANWLVVNFGGEMHATTATITNAIFGSTLTAKDIACLLRRVNKKPPAKRVKK